MEPWQEKISKGIELIIEGCKENASWLDCQKCPFGDVCDCITEHSGDFIINNSEAVFFTPDVWEEYKRRDEKEEEEK